MVDDPVRVTFSGQMVDDPVRVTFSGQMVDDPVRVTFSGQMVDDPVRVTFSGQRVAVLPTWRNCINYTSASAAVVLYYRLFFLEPVTFDYPNLS